MGNLRNLALGSASALAAAAYMMGASPAALANVLTAGTGGPPDVLPYGSSHTTAASMFGTFTSSLGSNDFSGDFVEYVVRDPDNTFGAGDLTWYLAVSNNGGSGEDIATVSASLFTGWETDVGYITLLTGDTPSSVSRGSSGSDINFEFANGIDAGAYTEYLAIMTNATNFYKADNLSFSNDGVATGLGFAPGVPEPSTWALLLLGFGGLGFGGFARRCKASISIA